MAKMHVYSAVVVASLVSLSLAGCKKKEESAGAAASASASAAPPVASAAPPPTAEPVPTPATPPPIPAKAGASIEACCNALAAVSKSGKTPVQKLHAEKAHSVCAGIAKNVKDGQTSRFAALTQIKSALVGDTAPGECN